MLEESSETIPPPNADQPVKDSNFEDKVSSEQSRAISKISFDGDWRKYAAVKVSTEYDSEESAFNNKISARVFNGLAKVKASFQRDGKGLIRYPQLGFVTKYLSVLYDHDDQNVLVSASADLGRWAQLKCLTDLKAQQGELKLATSLADASYKAEVSCDVPPTGLPRTILTFPKGEIKLEDELRDETRALSINGFVAGNLLNGLCVAEYKDENLNLKYRYKDEEMTVTPCVSLPSNALSFEFKRQFNPLNKLSYVYKFDSAAWSAVYKHKPNENFKIKVGYDSEVRLGWASAWVGREDVGAKKAPRKCKVQVMFQVPQDDIHSSAVLFKVKKRWDL